VRPVLEEEASPVDDAVHGPATARRLTTGGAMGIGAILTSTDWGTIAANHQAPFVDRAVTQVRRSPILNRQTLDSRLNTDQG
jgi:hypothetical protein